MDSSTAAVFHYHQRTKHQLNAYAKGPESLDWEDQPHPFRRFKGCETICLPSPGAELAVLFADLDRPDQIPPQPLNLTSLGLLLELAFGLSAWKQYGVDRWALRCNPSSGNLHPTEAYVICTDPHLLQPGVYHYVSHDHALERRCQLAANDLSAAVYIGLSSIHWREAWKYGERAFRYCQHDIGHALAGLSYAAACLGWSIELCSDVSDSEIGHWLGLDRLDDFIAEEHEAADLFCRVNTQGQMTTPFQVEEWTNRFQSAQWFGQAERLSEHHFYHWPVIEQTARDTLKPRTPPSRQTKDAIELPSPLHSLPASQLIRQRRSAQQFNALADPLPLTAFHRLLQALLPNAKPPFDAWNWPSQVHVFLFVHRVEGLEPGLYFLPRGVHSINELKAAFSADFVWDSVEAPFEFYRLIAGDVRQASKTLSCHQAIASDSAFNLGMLARFAENIEAEAWRYRRLFWECGLIGQILYLEAEAAGVRGTGIGCFFDDVVHGVLGLTDQSWQSLYHFTVGEPLNDARLQTLAAYHHLQP